MLAFVLAITLWIALASALGATSALADQAPETTAETQPVTDAPETADSAAAVEDDRSTPGNAAALTADLNDGIAAQSIVDDAGPLEVFFLALVNREWVYVDANGNFYSSPSDAGYVKNYTTHQDTAWGGKAARWFVTADQLETVYARLGFSSRDLIRSANSGEGQTLFPHVEESGVGTGQPRGNVWADTRPWYDGSDTSSAATGFSDPTKWRIPGIQATTQNAGKRIYYYYLPNNTTVYGRNPQQYPEYITQDASPTKSTLMSANSFYTVEVDDHENLVYAEGEERPETGYACARTAYSYTLKVPGTGAAWCVYVNGSLVSDDSGRYTIEFNGDGTVTYTFPYSYESEHAGGTDLGVNGRVVFAPVATEAGSHTIAYVASMTSDQLQDIGDYKAGSQHFDEANNATVMGKAQTVETFDDESGSYVVLAPDTDQVYTTDEGAWNAKGRKFLYEFQGWKVNGTDVLLQPGDELSRDDLNRYAPSGVLSLKAQWRLVLDNGYSTTCNFFVNTTCEVQDNLENGYTSHTGDSYTTSVYATSVYGAEGIAASADGKAKNIQVTETDTQMNCYELDRQIRNSVTTPVPLEYDYTGVSSDNPNKKPVPVDYTGEGISLKSLPSDEEALAGVRAWVAADESHEVTIDGESIAAQDITSANFTIRWYVLKNQKSDGWHVDGILVAKKAQLVVTKTFEGDSEAIDALSSYSASDFAGNEDTQHFYIAVTHEHDVDGEQQAVTDYQLLTVPDSEVTRASDADRRYGYTSYDESTHTYYWELETRQGREYSLQEMNSVYKGTGEEGVSWNNSRWVNVRNSGDSDTGGWIEYDEGSAVTARLKAASLPSDLPMSARQTVSFRNLYVHSGTLVVRKTDYTTGDPMAHVKFFVTDEDGCDLYRKKGTNEYTTDPLAASDINFEPVEDNKVETDENGTFYLELDVTEATSAKTGTYTLAEDYDTAPGYMGARSVTVTVTNEQGITGDIQVDGDDSSITWAQKGKSNFSLDIVNRSQELTTLAAKKHWEGGTVDAKPVKVQLWRTYGPGDDLRSEPVPDGTVTVDGAEAPRLLDEDGNAASNTVELGEDNSWCFRWSALPLFIDNYEVTYSLRETWIGDTSYDASADADSGYASYKVSYDVARFTYADAAPDVTSDTDYKAGFSQATSWWVDESGKTVYSNHELLAVNNAEKQGQITFTKKDRTGNGGQPLAGAEFALFYDETCTREVTGARVSSTDAGIVSFPKVPVGTYYFRETKAPAGYTYAENAVYKAVVTSGDPVITLVGDVSQQRVTAVTNKFGAALKIHKVGGGDLGLEGAEFSVTKADGTGEWASAHTGVTAADGNLWITGVSQGTYTVTETKAALGYETPDEDAATFTFTVDTRGAVISADPGEFGEVFYAWQQVSDSSEETGGNGVVFELSARNKAQFSLPTTGGLGIGATTCAAVALMCAAVRAAIVGNARPDKGAEEKEDEHE